MPPMLPVYMYMMVDMDDGHHRISSSSAKRTCAPHVGGVLFFLVSVRCRSPQSAGMVLRFTLKKVCIYFILAHMLPIKRWQNQAFSLITHTQQNYHMCDMAIYYTI